MKKYKILENRPELNQTDIEKGMDFKKVKIKAGVKTPMSFSKVIITGTIGVVAIAGISTILLVNKPTADEKKISVQAEVPQELHTIENPLKNFKINSGKDTTLVFESGSLLKIPAGAFADSSGNPITGEVNLHYREFHNVGEIILAGIPMRYDSAGKEFHFESAGMFEITGEQNNKALFVAKDKSIEVKMISLNADSSKFNQYYLEDNKWVYKNQDKPDFINVVEPVKADSISKPARNLIQKFVKPVKRNKNKQQFMIDVNPESYPELAVFRKVIFEVSPKMKDFDPAKANQAWYDADIQRMETRGEYKITFKGMLNGKPEEYTVVGYPVVDEADYSEAIKKYNSLSEAYEQKLEKKSSTEKIKEGKLNSQLAQYVDAMNRYRKLAKENYQILQQSFQTQNLVYRTFVVQRFGIYNSDCPRMMPQGIILAADFQNENGKALDPSLIYLVQKGVNGVYTFYPSRPISFNPGENNILLVISKDNTIGWVTKETLDQVGPSEKKHTFKMHTVRKSAYSASDINNLLI